MYIGFAQARAQSRITSVISEEWLVVLPDVLGKSQAQETLEIFETSKVDCKFNNIDQGATTKSQQEKVMKFA